VGVSFGLVKFILLEGWISGVNGWRVAGEGEIGFDCAVFLFFLGWIFGCKLLSLLVNNGVTDKVASAGGAQMRGKRSAPQARRADATAR
jgi:hypothetical protein